jgi:hypothetical protein
MRSHVALCLATRCSWQPLGPPCRSEQGDSRYESPLKYRRFQAAPVGVPPALLPRALALSFLCSGLYFVCSSLFQEEQSLIVYLLLRKGRFDQSIIPRRRSSMTALSAVLMLTDALSASTS